ncbi:low affinity immunoglobulin gamma Fc region receptor III-B-like [Channa argus]|uniref:low affinity immunoglobulin gamma Fc region receptor III-B-like n=1 Tax=Channa argus TaxID=215402 RepID=UPI0035222DA3
MEDTALCIRLLLFILLLLAAHIHHNNAEKTAGSVLLESPLFPVMEGDDVTLRCRNKMSLINLTANFYKDDVLISCSATGYMTIHSVMKSDEGLYKCNISGAGESPVSWLSVIASAVILDSPIHPVMEGDSVTLRCRKTETATDHIADFYSHGIYIGTGYNGEMTIHSVSKSDEGPLKCSISGAGDSPERWLTVTVAVILETPVLPVIEGESVTLHCRNKMATSNMAHFYKNDIFIGSSFTGNLTLQSITKSDEGRYKCNVSGGQESAQNWLDVRECPNKAIQLCSDQLPVLLYLFVRTVATILWVALLLLVLRKHHYYQDW